MTITRAKAVACAAVALGIFLGACHTPMQGRDWRLLDKRADWKSTKVGIVLEEGKNKDNQMKEFWNKAGCLQWRTTAVVVDNVDRWNVYECVDWTVTPVVGRTSERLVVTDPPNKEYLGSTTKARPDEIVNIEREKTGLDTEQLPVNTYPVLVEWQVTTTDGRKWLESGDQKIACSGSWTVGAEDQRQRTVTLCEPEFNRMLATTSQTFVMTFKVSPQAWEDAQRATTPPSVITCQGKMTRELIMNQLKQLLGKGAEQASMPSAAPMKKPAPAGKAGGAP